MAIIALEKMTFRACHGCFKEENIIGNLFEVDLQMETDTSKAEKSDRVKDTVNYAEVYELVKKEMAITSNTIENTAARILDCIHNAFPQITQTTVKLSKLHPSLSGEVERSSITLISGQ
ncbi:MAG: dihydroneopterin aldolase [Bacteroidales bacterium]|nr:dihydroneopterin aldolase [Bacteroidales bacterium]